MGKAAKELRYLEGNYSQGNMGRRLLETGQDVAQAMELEEEAYSLARLMEEEKAKREAHHYLVEGAILTCTACTLESVKPFEKEFTAPAGSDEIKLKVTIGEITGNGLKFATVKDCKMGEGNDCNINFFGNCKNLPDRLEEIERVKEAEKWEENLKQGTCRLLMNLEDEWENMLGEEGYETNSNLQSNGIEEITMESILFCKHGGFIYPKSSGYGSNNQLDKKADYVRDILTALGWPIDNEELQYLCGVLEDFGISDDSSIACFLLICATESGPAGTYIGKYDRNGEEIVDQYGRAVVEDYPIGYENNPEIGYSFEERGVGYIMVTKRDAQYNCLTYLKEQGYWHGEIDENAAGYVSELRTMPWEASAWRWAVFEQSGEGNLNAYVTTRAMDEERGRTNGLTREIFLAAESFINGKVTGDYAKYLGEIVRGEKDWEYEKESNTIIVEVKGKLNGKIDEAVEGEEAVEIEVYSAPNNWENFEANYAKLADGGVV